MHASVRGTIYLLIGGMFVFSLDQLCKYYFFEHDHPFAFLGGWIQSVHHQNYGIAFNLPIPQWLILTITLIACIGVLVLFVRTRATKQTWLPFFLGLLLGGALGNGVDRWSLGFVRDWLLLWHLSAINIADIGVLAGLLGTVLLSQKALPEQDAGR
jgi:signal peptidase II